jgi:hypothetical protein
VGFAERAVVACEKAMMGGHVSEGQVRDVLKSKRVDGSLFVPYLGEDEIMVRRVAARIVASKGPIGELVKAALVEKDRGLLVDMLQWIGKNTEGTEQLEILLTSDDTIIRDSAIEMFRRIGKPDSLLALIFSDDESMVEKIKGYLHEKRQD